MVAVKGPIEDEALRNYIAQAAEHPIELDPGLGYFDGKIDPATEIYEYRYGIFSHGGAVLRVRFDLSASGVHKELQVIRIA